MFSRTATQIQNKASWFVRHQQRSSLNQKIIYQFAQKHQTSQNADALKILVGFIGILGLGSGGYIFYQNQEKKNTAAKGNQLATQSIEKLRIQAIENEEKKKEEVITMFSDVNDKMVRYPGDPSSEIMLADFSIYGDLQWYEVKPEYFSDPEDQSLLVDVEKNTIKKARINERLMHAFEAERILQNIFVDVKDVLNEIQQTGTYTPPGVFMKFYGYIYFQIRNKPIIVDNLIKAQKQISLFDLYFRYQSPVLYYHNEYSEIPIRPADFDNTAWLPNVHLNTKAIPKFQLVGKVKNLFAARSKANTVEDSRYRFAWTNHYQ